SRRLGWSLALGFVVRGCSFQIGWSSYISASSQRQTAARQGSRIRLAFSKRALPNPTLHDGHDGERLYLLSAPFRFFLRGAYLFSRDLTGRKKRREVELGPSFWPLFDP